MATRWYFQTSTAAAVSPSVDPDWERNVASFARYRAFTTKQNTALADVSNLFGSTATSQTCWRQWVSDKLSAQSLSGNFSIIVRGLEGIAQEDCHLACVLRVMSEDGATERAVLFTSLAAATEFATTAQTRLLGGAITDYTCVEGDRLCLEVGMHGVTPANTNNVTLRFGDPSATSDFAFTSGLTTDLVPWWELSMDVVFHDTNPSGSGSGGASYGADGTGSRVAPVRTGSGSGGAEYGAAGVGDHASLRTGSGSGGAEYGAAGTGNHTEAGAATGVAVRINSGLIG